MSSKHQQLINWGLGEGKSRSEIVQALTRAGELNDSSLGFLSTLNEADLLEGGEAPTNTVNVEGMDIKVASFEDLEKLNAYQKNEDGSYTASSGGVAESLTAANRDKLRIENEPRKGLQGLLTEYRDLIEKEGFELGDDADVAGKMTGLKSNILASVKQAETLGTLDSGLITFMKELIGADTTGMAAITNIGGKRSEKIVSQLNVALDKQQADIDANMRLLGGGEEKEMSTLSQAGEKQPNIQEAKARMSELLTFAKENPDDELSQKFMEAFENDRIDLMTGKIKSEFKEKTPEETLLDEKFKAAGLEEPTNDTVLQSIEAQQEESGLFQDATSTPDEPTLLSRWKDTFSKAQERQSGITDATAQEEQTLAEGTLQTMANGIHMVVGFGEDTITEALDLATSDEYVNEKLTQFSESEGGKAFLEFTEETGKDIETFIEENPRAARNLAVPLTLLELATIGGAGMGAKATGKTAQGFAQATKGMATSAKDAISSIPLKTPKSPTKIINRVKNSTLFNFDDGVKVTDRASAVNSVKANIKNLVEDKRTLTKAYADKNTDVADTIAERYADLMDINLDTKKLVTGTAQNAAKRDTERYANAITKLFDDVDETSGKIQVQNVIDDIQKAIDDPSVKTAYVNAGGKTGSFQKDIQTKFNTLTEQYPNGMSRSELWEFRKGIDKAINTMSDTNAAKDMRNVTRTSLQKQLLASTPEEIQGSVEAGFKEMQKVIEAKDFLKTLDAQAIVGGRMTDIIRNSAGSQVGAGIVGAATGTGSAILNPFLGVGGALAGYGTSVKIGQYFAKRSIVTPKAKKLLKAHAKKDPQFMKDLEAYTKETKDTSLLDSVKDALGGTKKGFIDPKKIVDDVSGKNSLATEAKKYKSADEFIASKITETEGMRKFTLDKPFTSPKKIYRGVQEDGSGSDFAMVGEGLYTSTSKKEAAKYGVVKEMGSEALPDNPIRFKTMQDFKQWEYEQAKQFGIDKRGMSKYGEIQDRIKALGYDGATIGEGNDMNIVQFDIADTTKTKSKLTDIWNKANKTKGVKIGNKTIKQIDEPTKKELIEAIDYLRLEKETKNAEDIISRLAEKYGISQDMPNAKIADKFEQLVEQTKTSDTLPATKLKD